MVSNCVICGRFFNGHWRSKTCSEACFKKHKNNRNKNWYDNNKEKVLICRKNYYEKYKNKLKDNPELRIKQYAKNSEWRKNNQHRIKKYRIKNRDIYNKYRRERYKNDLEYRERKNNLHNICQRKLRENINYLENENEKRRTPEYREKYNNYMHERMKIPEVRDRNRYRNHKWRIKKRETESLAVTMAALTQPKPIRSKHEHQ
jgi:FtsZ-interacting cell division protein ZipA